MSVREPLKAFICYSHIDRKYAAELYRNLMPLCEAGRLQIRWDEDLLPGDEFGPLLAECIAETDFAFVLTTDSLLTHSPYFRDHELPALKRLGRRVIPVVLWDCDWKHSWLGSFNPLPRNGEPLSEYLKKHRDVSEYFLDVRRGVASLLDRGDLAKKKETDPGPAVDALRAGQEKDRVAEIRREFLSAENYGGNTVLVLAGPPGIGKTHLARLYYNCYRDAYQTRLWCTASTISMLNAEYRRHGAEVARAAGRESEPIAYLLEHLSSLRENWLAVLDDAGEREVQSGFKNKVREYIPEGSSGHIIITSRSDVWEDAKVLSVDPMSEKEAIDLLWRNRKELCDEGALLEVAKELGYLPLALRQAAAFMANRRIGAREYLVSFRQKRSRVLSWSAGPVPCHDSLKRYSVAAVLQMTLSDMERRDVHSAHLFQVCSTFANEGIPTTLLRNVPKIAASGMLMGWLRLRLNELKNRQKFVERRVSLFCTYGDSLEDHLPQLYDQSIVFPAADNIAVHALFHSLLRESLSRRLNLYFRCGLLALATTLENCSPETAPVFVAHVHSALEIEPIERSDIFRYRLACVVSRLCHLLARNETYRFNGQEIGAARELFEYAVKSQPTAESELDYAEWLFKQHYFDECRTRLGRILAGLAPGELMVKALRLRVRAASEQAREALGTGREQDAKNAREDAYEARQALGPEAESKEVVEALKELDRLFENLQSPCPVERALFRPAETIPVSSILAHDDAPDAF